MRELTDFIRAPSGILSAGLRDWAGLQAFVIAAGMLAAVVFIAAGLAGELQLYADGSIFAYLVALQDSWGVHWHNISGRVTVYLATCLPAELYVALTGNPRAGIALYGLLFFSAQLLGLVGTYAADRSPRRLVFTAACLSTTCLCPLVYGFPTELWFTHALFWPALAIANYAPLTFGSFLALLAAVTALVHTHGAGVVFAMAVLLTAALRQPGALLDRGLRVFTIAMLIWVVMQLAFRPDDQFTPVLARAAVNFIDPGNLIDPVFGLLVCATIGYAALFAVLHRAGLWAPAVWACTLVAAMLAFYWFALDQSLLTEDRYFLRTAVFYLAPALGIVTLVLASQQEGRTIQALTFLPNAARLLRHPVYARAAAGALALVILVHVVETAKFIDRWDHYREFVRTLANAPRQSTRPGEDRFVSSHTIPSGLNQLSWSSTTHYLSVVATPDLNPVRLVINPDEGYHWVTCELAKRHVGHRAVPEHARKLVAAHACGRR